MPVFARPTPSQASDDARPARWQRRTAVVLLLAAAASTLPLGAAEHTVSPGEVLSGIADDHDVSVDDLVALNDLTDPDIIYIGQVLKLPGSSAAPEANTTTSVHVVEAGDSIWEIARRYDTTIPELIELNGLGDASLIFIGQEIRLAQAAPENTAPDDEDEPSGLEEEEDERDDATPRAPVVYTVEAGDTLSGIAGAHSVDLAVLLALNGLTLDSVIVPGQAILIGTHTSELSADELRDLPSDLLADPERLALMPVFDHWADEYGVDHSLVKALAWFESGWNNEVVSSAGALGIGQVLPITADFVSEVLLGETLDPLVPEDNIRLSIRYLRYLLDQTDSIDLAIASYYQGLTATRRHGIYTSSQFYVDGILALRSRFD